MKSINERELIDTAVFFLSSIDSQYINTLKLDESFIKKVENFRKLGINVLSKDIDVIMQIVYEGLIFEDEIDNLEKELIAMFLAIIPISKIKKQQFKNVI